MNLSPGTKGIVLAGGKGSRLYPSTFGVSKQLLPIYDKPLIYYPISVLMLAGISEILIISSPNDVESYRRIFGTGSSLGLKIEYRVQDEPRGLVDAFLIGEDFIAGSKVCLVLGDNIFWGQGFSNLLMKSQGKVGATVFGCFVNDPERFGVAEFDKDNNVIGIEEKPKNPKSNFAVTGLYFYDEKVVDYAREVMPSDRGELEISSLNQIYIEKSSLNIELLGRGFAWLDTGTQESMLEASNFVAAIERRQGLKIACLEEIALKNKWITKADVFVAAERMKSSEYGKYLRELANNVRF